jgi:plasmid stabilization system protein ParE
MPLPVKLSDKAEPDLEEAYVWALQHAPLTAKEWRERFLQALLSLADTPERCAFAAEEKKLRCGLRQFLFGKKPNVFRVLFTIADAEVRILTIRRAARRGITRRDIS